MDRIPEIAMYYPYIHIRDDSWLKAAALYWPRLARLAPEGFPRYDSEVAKALDGDLGFLLNIEPPATQVAQVATEFLEFVAIHHEELKRRYTPNTENDCVPLWHEAMHEIAQAYRHPFHGSVHVRKMTSALRQELIHYGLGKPVDNDTWVATHPVIGAAYAMTLVDRVAKANKLAVVTDQQILHELHGISGEEEFASTLLGTTSEIEGGRTRTADGIAALYASLAIKAVIPKRIDTVPIERIIKARTKLADEFDIFREHLNTLAEEFSELGQVENMTILQEQLKMLVDRDLRCRTAALERNLRQLGLEPTSAILGLKTLELPGLAAAVTPVAGIPDVIGQAGLASARLVTASARARAKRRDARQRSPVGYLLGLKRQIGQRGFVERIRRPFG